MTRTHLWLAPLFLAVIAHAASKDRPPTSSVIEIYRPEVFVDFRFGPLPKTPNAPIPGLWYVRLPPGAAREYGYGDLSAWLQKRKVPGLDVTGSRDLDNASLAQIFPEGFAASPDPGDPAPYRFRLLKLGGTASDDRSVSTIQSLRHLEVLSLPGSFTDAGVRALAGLWTLRALNMRGASVTDQSADTLKSLFRLERLDLRGTKISDSGVNALIGLPLLELSLGPGVTDKAMTRLAGFPHLGQLDASETSVTGAALATLSKLPLHTLFLGKSMTDAGMPALAKLKGLRRLDLTGASITDSGAYQGLRLAGLEELALTDTGVTNAMLARLATLPRLRTLEISGTRVTPAGWPALQKSVYLQVLSFSSSAPVTSGDMAPLLSCPSLRTLIINGKALPPEALAEMRKQPKKIARLLKAARLPASPPSGLQAQGLVFLQEAESALDQILPSITDPAKVDPALEKKFLQAFTAK